MLFDEKLTSGPAGPLLSDGCLPTQAVGGDDRPVPLDVVLLDVVEQVAAATDQHQQASPAVVVLLVHLEVLVEVVDALGEKRDLHLGGPGVGVVELVRADGGVLCPACVDSEQELIEAADASDKQWLVVAQELRRCQIVLR